MIKIIVATMQIVSSFGKVLNIPFSQLFTALLQILELFKFDLAATFGIGCLVADSYFTSLAFSLAAPVGIATIVFIECAYQRCRASGKELLHDLFAQFDKNGNGVSKDQLAAILDTAKASVTTQQMTTLLELVESAMQPTGRIEFDAFCSTFDRDSTLSDPLRVTRRAKAVNDSIGRLFLLIFLLYPGITNTIFAIFLCRDLGPNTAPTSVLHADYSIDCDETQSFRWTVGLSLIVVWPIGLPAILFYLMYRSRAQIAAGDGDTLKMFRFVIDDYKLQYWYWEVVELFRKLIMSGLISLVGRGTIAQAALATVVSFFFFALNLRLAPYKSGTLNVFKAISEIQLFLILLVCLILQVANVGFSGELITVDGYGMVQTGATTVIIPVVIVVVVFNMRKLLSEAKVTPLTQSTRLDARPDAKYSTKYSA